MECGVAYHIAQVIRLCPPTGMSVHPSDPGQQGVFCAGIQHPFGPVLSQGLC